MLTFVRPRFWGSRGLVSELENLDADNCLLLKLDQRRAYAIMQGAITEVFGLPNTVGRRLRISRRATFAC
jgi:hypothetical protein